MAEGSMDRARDDMTSGAWPRPRVQVAMDATSMEEATTLAAAALEAGADQLQIGKPLIEFLGLQGAVSVIGRFPSVHFAR